MMRAGILMPMLGLMLVMNLAAEEQGRLTFALSADFMATHDKRFTPSRGQHVEMLLGETKTDSFRILCLGEKMVTPYENKEFLDLHFDDWLKECDPLVAQSRQAKETAKAGYGSSVAKEDAVLFEAGEAARETLVILDWPALREGYVPGPEAFDDPKFELAIPEGGPPVAERGDVYWYFSRTGLETSLGNLLQGKDGEEKDTEVKRCQQALARMWATYLSSKGFRLKAFDVGIPGGGEGVSPGLTAAIKNDRPRQAVAPYDLKKKAPPVPKPAAKASPPGSLRVIVEWKGSNVVLPVFRERSGKHRVIAPAPVGETPDESQKEIFKSYKTLVAEGGRGIGFVSRADRYRTEARTPVTHRRELAIPLGEDGRAKGELNLYLYYGTVASPAGFPVLVRWGDDDDPVVQKLVFLDVEGQGELGRTAAPEFHGNWKRVELP